MASDFISDKQMKQLEKQGKDGTTYQKVGKDEWQEVETTVSDIQAQQKPQERPWYAFDIKNVPAGFVRGLENIDRYTDAPVRKFVTEQVTGKELTRAPTGAEQAQMLGATDKSYGEMWNLPDWVPGRNISPADIYGAGLEAVQSPFLIGSGLLRGISGTKSALKKSGTKKTLKATQSGMAKSQAGANADVGVQIRGGDLQVEQGGKLFDYKQPRSLEELRDWEPASGANEVVGAKRLRQIEKTLPDLQTAPLEYHHKLLENPKAMKKMKLEFENLPTEDAQKIAAYNQQMLYEARDKIDDTVAKIGGGTPRGSQDAGLDFIDAAKTKYQAEKEMLGPAFEKLAKTRQKVRAEEATDLIQAIGANSKIGKLLKQGDDGRWTLGKIKPRSGLSQKEYNVLKDVVEDLNDGMSFKEIQDARDYMRKAIDPANPGATREIEKVRSYLLGQLDELAAKTGPDVADTFRQYAINERGREAVEKVIGGKVEHLDDLYRANPDQVVKRIFSNPNHTKVVSEYIGPEKMNELVAAHIQAGIEKATDSVRGFSPSKFKTWLKSNQSVLKNNLAPGVKERIEALADLGYLSKRFLDEVNPSGTAASLKEMLEPKGLWQSVRQGGIIGGATGHISTKAAARSKQKQAIKMFNELMQENPMPKKPGLLLRGQRAADNAAVFQGSAAGARALSPFEDSRIPEEERAYYDSNNSVLQRAIKKAIQADMGN